jgi:hypothetical protein
MDLQMATGLIVHKMVPIPSHMSGTIPARQRCLNCGLENQDLRRMKRDRQGLQWFTLLTIESIPCREFDFPAPDWSQTPM